jgi:serine acetyltransferase
VGNGLVLEHHALGVVIHPNVRIGNGVRIYHGVTLAGESWIGSGHNIEIGDGAVIGVGAIIVPRTNRGLRIGRNAAIGAGAVVTNDVADGTTVVGVPARPIDRADVRDGPLLSLRSLSSDPGVDQDRTFDRSSVVVVSER